MRIWTVHTDGRGPQAGLGAGPVRGAGSVPATGGPPPRAPVLVPERFSLAAFVFNLLWLLWHRLWLAALLYLLAALALGLLLPPGPGFAAGIALQFLLGTHAQDLRRRALARRGYRLAGVVAAPDEDAALARLLDRQPALATPLLRAAAPA